MAGKRLIDADVYDAILKNREETLIEYSGLISGAIKGCRALLADQPTIDAVEVVRCKDCKYGMWDEESEMYKCLGSAEFDDETGEYYGFLDYHEADFFCSDGERKDNEG